MMPLRRSLRRRRWFGGGGIDDGFCGCEDILFWVGGFTERDSFIEVIPIRLSKYFIYEIGTLVIFLLLEFILCEYNKSL